MTWWAFIQDVPRGSTPASWLVAWLPRGKRHVWLARRIDEGDGPEVWIVLDPAGSGLSAFCECIQTDFIADRVSAGLTAVCLHGEHDPAKVYCRGWMTCVALAKYLTGIRAWWVLTPGQLIEYARRKGWEVREPCTTPNYSPAASDPRPRARSRRTPVAPA